MQKQSSMLLILLAAMLWGTTGTSQAFAPEAAHPIAIGAVRLAVGGLFLLSLVLLTGKLTLKRLAAANDFSRCAQHGRLSAVVLFRCPDDRSRRRNGRRDRQCADFFRSD